MEYEEIVVKESPGLCRCCLSEGCYKDLGTEYTWMNEAEIYADMLLECFDISITQHNDGPNGPNRLICEVCITRLRDACNFKKQVLDAEKKFVDMMGRGEFRPKMLIYQAQLKTENTLEEMPADEANIEYLEEDIDFDDGLLNDDPAEPSLSEDITVTSLPVKAKRGRPRKSSTIVKPEKKAKVPKLDDKPRTSKAPSKEELVDAMEKDPKLREKKRKDDLARLLTVVIESSTIMPFRWFGNNYKCFYCCCTFTDSERLKEHTKEEHREAKLKNLLLSLAANTRVKLDISEISCKRCTQQIKDLDDFLDHVASVHDVKFNKEAGDCLFSFKLSDDGMVCLDCGQHFRFFAPLLKHVHNYHNKSNAYPCEICGQGFVAKANVQSHIQNVHPDAALARCHKCCKTFESQRALAVHNETVHASSIFKCPKCPEVLKSRYLKRRHMALVHNATSSVFPCDQCPKVFMWNSKLVYHKSQVHLKEKTITCQICGFRVFNKELLKRHLVKHDDSRPFQCEICKKAFQRKKTLEFHIRIHTNDKRYICKDCGKAFVQISSLKLHLRVHHSLNIKNEMNELRGHPE